MTPAARVFFYRPLASPLHATRPGLAAVWTAVLVAAAIVLYHPLALLALLLALLVAGAGAHVGNQLVRALRVAAFVAVPIVLVNVLVSRQGLTVFARLGSLGPFGQGDLTVEALAYGAVIALKVAIVMLAGTLASLAIDPDQLLRLARRLSYRSALTAALALRMIPLLAADAQRLGEAQRTRGELAPRSGRARLAILTGVVTSSLDRAMDVAATLEVRGYASARIIRRRRRPGAPPRWRAQQSWSRHDIAFTASAAVTLALIAAAASWAPFRAYPRLHVPLDTTVAVCSAALLVVLVLPFGDRRGVGR